MKISHTLCLASLLLCCAPLASLAQQSRLDGVLKQMDEASTKFKSAQADFTQDLYERVVKETTTETGSVYFERKGTSTEMGLKIQPPNTRFIEYKNGIARIFDPGANHITEIRAAQYERFLTLGFGGSGHDLAAAWDITDQGPEQLNDGSGTVTVEKARPRLEGSGWPYKLQPHHHMGRSHAKPLAQAAALHAIGRLSHLNLHAHPLQPEGRCRSVRHQAGKESDHRSTLVFRAKAAEAHTINTGKSSSV